MSDRFSLPRIRAIVRKDVEEVRRQPALLVPALLMVIGLAAPTFLITIIVPRLSDEPLSSNEFADAAAGALFSSPELQGLAGEALVQAYLLHQFLMFGLLVPVLGSLSIAAHSIIGEKQSKALEPLLCTPITTAELLAAKTVTPFLISLGLLVITFLLYLAGMMLFGEPGVWQTLFGRRTLVLYAVAAPLLTFASLLLAAIVSSRVNDSRSAQQLGAFIVLPITGVFVAQLAGQFLIGAGAMLIGAVGFVVLDLALLWIGTRVFQRETILMRWK